LLKAADFGRVFESSRQSRDRFFTLLYRGNQAGEPRLGFAIGKKAVRAAAVRNRIRRVCRESFRHQREHLGALDIIILARQPAAAASNAELFDSLAAHWQRIADDRDRHRPAR
jgi:ribonuclease P protein component